VRYSTKKSKLLLRKPRLTKKRHYHKQFRIAAIDFYGYKIPQKKGKGKEKIDLLFTNDYLV